MSVVTKFQLLKYRRTKIVATVGPSSNSRERIEALIRQGVDVFRINFSHGEQSDHGEAIALIRQIAAQLGTHTAVLADLCGPKIRTGKFEGGSAVLTSGAAVSITGADVVGSANLIPSQYAALVDDVGIGDRVLLNDGAIELCVTGKSAGEVACEVIYGGTISNHKGINLPGTDVSASSLTEKDQSDARFALANAVDFLALSFVRTANDVNNLKALIDEEENDAAVIAKIEKPEALQNAEAIVEAADGIMVARGDLGVELNPEQVPLAQSQLIDMARARNCPVIVATQMLESMIDNPRPTRAEVSDVAQAVTSGADAVMLSGESAVGAYPLEAVGIMDRIARQTESYFWGREFSLPEDEAASYTDSVADATAKLIADTRARGVLTISIGGFTALTISGARPKAPVVAISNNASTCRRMNLAWGMIPRLESSVGSENPNDIARRVAVDLGLAQDGEFVVLVRGFHADPKLDTPTITLMKV
ncbi:MAG: pyruvate kinase [Pseudomonadota bacterium]